MVPGSFVPTKVFPISSGATAETIDFYRWLVDMGRRTCCPLGTSDHFANMAAGQALFETEAAFYETSGGRRPLLLCYEYHDALWVSRYGADGAETMRQKVIASHARGQRIAIHNTGLGNPATGQLSREGQTYPFPGGSYAGTGYVYDLTGSPVTAALPGGSKNADFVAYLDRLAVWLASLTDAQGRKIPVMFRWLHECNGGWFWWAAEGAAKFIELWRYVVEYMRDTKGATNLLYTWNCDAYDVFTAWYPGDAWVDVVSLDFYDNTASPVFSFDARFNELIALTSSRPFVLGEHGAALHRNRPAFWDEAAAALPTKYSKFSAAMLWRSPWGPALGDPPATVAAFSSFASSPRMLTL